MLVSEGTQLPVYGHDREALKFLLSLLSFLWLSEILWICIHTVAEPLIIMHVVIRNLLNHSEA